MKLVTYRQEGGEARAGLAVLGYIVDLEKGAKAIKEKLPASLRAVLAQGPEALAAARRVEARSAALFESGHKPSRLHAWIFPEDEIQLAPPLPDPEKIICLGLNYRDHIREQEGRLHATIELPKDPIIFSKFATALAGPYDPIKLPPERVTRQVDYEVELALVIGRTARAVSQQEAAGCVAGYMVLNDVSARDCQFADKQWVRAKSFDGFAPCGPWLVTPDELGDPHKLRLWTILNGTPMQQSTTRHMIFKIPRIISYISQAITLKPGDIISTGTPAGVGFFREPPVVLKPGDTVECGIEGIGTICNTCERVK